MLAQALQQVTESDACMGRIRYGGNTRATLLEQGRCLGRCMCDALAAPFPGVSYHRCFDKGLSASNDVPSTGALLVLSFLLVKELGGGKTRSNYWVANDCGG